MQKSPRNFHKIYTGTKHVNKAKKMVLPFYHISPNTYAISNLSGSKHKIEVKP